MYWVAANCIARHCGGQPSWKLTGMMTFPRTSASFTSLLVHRVWEGGRAGGREREREGGRGGGKEGEREGGREGGRERGRKGGREGGREGGRRGRGEREGGSSMLCSSCKRLAFSYAADKDITLKCPDISILVNIL